MDSVNREGLRVKRLVDQQGFSLVEELVALGLVALGLVLLVAMITTGSIGVTTMGDKTTANALARSQLESIKAAPYMVPTSDINPYPTVSAPSPYTVTVDIDYRNASEPAGFQEEPNDSGLQLIIVEVRRAGDLLRELSDYKVNR